MILSAPAHSLGGWPALRAELTRVDAPADLVLGLQIGWHFAGAAIRSGLRHRALRLGRSVGFIQRAAQFCRQVVDFVV